jgi:hypothetical protein
MTKRKRGPGRPPLAIPSKQVGIRVPIPLWKSVLKQAASFELRPGAYVAGILRIAIEKRMNPHGN